MDSFVKTFVKELQKANTAITNNEYELIMNGDLEKLNAIEKMDFSFYRDMVNEDKVISSFKSRNVNGWDIIPITYEEDLYGNGCTCGLFNPNGGRDVDFSLYAIKAPDPSDNEDVGLYANLTPGKLFNINNNSPYKINIKGNYTTINFFIRKDLFGRDLSTLEGRDLEVFVLDIRGCMYHFANFRCSDFLLENSINILTNNLTIAVARHFVTITPSNISEIFKTNIKIAESILDVYDMEKESFVILPWMI